MTEKQFKNSILIEGDYNFNYLTNLLFLSKTCIINIFEHKGLDVKKNKKMYKNVRNLCDFLNSSIDVFSRLSIQEKETKCILHTIEYTKDKPTPVPVLEDINLSDIAAVASECLEQAFKESDLSQATVASVDDIKNAFKNNKITTGIQLVDKLPDDVIKKNKEVDDKYNEEE